jgi:hypothetical protein
MMNAFDRLAAANPIPATDLGRLAELLPGPPSSGRGSWRARRMFSHRLVVAVAALLAIKIAAPAFALRAQLSETIHDFLASDAPPQAKSQIAQWVKSSAGAPEHETADQVDLVLGASGPEGELQLYSVHFTNGDVGTTIVDTSNDPPRVGGASSGPPRPLAAGQALDVRGSFIEFPGRSPVYFNGVIDPQVATVEIVYPGGHTQSVQTGNGYMLGWVLPQDDSYGDSELIAQNAASSQVGRMDICTIGRDVEFRPHTAEMPTDPSAACAIPPTPDPG